MFDKIRASRTKKKESRRQLDRELAAQERALIDDPAELDIELGQAESPARLARFGMFRRRPGSS